MFSRSVHETRTRLKMTPGTARTCRQPGNIETVWQPVAKHEPVRRILLPDKWTIVCSLQAPPAQRLHLAQRRSVQGVKPSNAPDHTLKVAGVDNTAASRLGPEFPQIPGPYLDMRAGEFGWILCTT